MKLSKTPTVRQSRLLRPAILGLLALASTAMAVNLAPGTSADLHGTTEGAHHELKGPVLQDVARAMTITIPSGTFSGKFHDRIVKETTSGTLDFYFWIEVTGNFNAKTLVVERDGFKGVSTDVDYRTDGLGTVAPYQAQRSTDGDAVSINFKNAAIGAGAKLGTRMTYIRTDLKELPREWISRVYVDGQTPFLVKFGKS